MQTQGERLTAIMDSEAGSLKLRDKIKCLASGPQLVIAPDENQQPSLQMGWQLTLWLNHDKLLNQDPITKTMGVGMELPPEALVRRAVQYLLEEARKTRDQANSPTVNGLAAQSLEDNPDMKAFIENMRAKQ